MESNSYQFFIKKFKNRTTTSLLDTLGCEYAFFKVVSNEFVLIRKRGIFENKAFIEDLQGSFALWEGIFEKGYLEFEFQGYQMLSMVDDINYLNFIIFFIISKQIPSSEVLALAFFQELAFLRESLEDLPVWLEEELGNAVYRTSPVLIISELGSGIEIFLKNFMRLKGFHEKKVQWFEPANLSKKVQLQELFGLDAGERLKTQRVIFLLEMDLEAIVIYDVVELHKEVQRQIYQFLIENKNPYWIFVSHYQIEKLVEIGEFDQNLWQVLKLNQVIIKPIREVKSLLENEMNHYISQLCSKYRRKIQIDEKAKNKILEYDWPGNLYEFYKTLETAFFICKDGIIKEEDLILNLWKISDRKNLNLRVATEDLEKKLILQAYRLVGGNQVHMANLLGISRGSLQYKISKYGIKG
ncbi:MAG: helix-turn-helix domain-containing protein [Leptonema sp. (in: bacteria)]